MKRNCLFIAAAVLSGILCGLPGVSIVWKLLIPFLSCGMAVILYLKSRGNEKTPLLFLFVLFILGALAGFFRTEMMNKTYNTQECRNFYQQYEASNPGEFDYALYLKTLGVKNETERKQLKERVPENENQIQRVLNDISERCEYLLDHTLDQKDSGILKAMLLGDKSSMDSETKQIYQSSGISHLLAVSGLHVGLIGTMCFRFLSMVRLTGKRLSMIISSIVVGIYCIFTGASASSVRAAVMFCIGTAAVLIGRKNDPVSTLSAAAVILLLEQPYLILQSGFLLSFTAMAGVYTGLYCISEYKVENKLLSSYISCILISVTTLPVIASSYYKAPLFSVLLNIIVIPLMSVLFLSGIGLLITAQLYIELISVPVLSLIISFLVRLFGFICSGLLSFYDFLGKSSLKTDFSQIVTGKPGPFKIAVYYLFLFVLIIILIKKKQLIGKAIPLLITAVYFASFLFLRTTDTEQAYVQILDVGQGDCFHIHEGNRDIVIDCGSTGAERAGSRILEPYLLSKGIEHLDMVIVSHADSDHMNGINYLLGEESQVKIDSIILPALAPCDEKYNVFKDQNNHVYMCHAGNGFSLGEGKLECVFCEETLISPEDTNRESSVWLYRYGAFSMLFTGDITSDEEKMIITNDKHGKLKNLSVLKAAHHGSKTASCNEFLDYISPEITILSYGANNRYGHPHSEVLERLKESGSTVMKTETSGAIKIEPSKKGYEIIGWKNEEFIQNSD